MTKFTFILLSTLFLTLIVVRVIQGSSNEELPAYMKFDAISDNHQTTITRIRFKSIYQPDSLLLESFKKDYSAIWGHLNHLYSTNDVVVGKEYYTESFFNHIANQYDGKITSSILREDVNHDIIIHNWAWDNLVCNLIDSNITFQYHFPNGTTSTIHATIAFVLLHEGRRWRIDAMKVLSESKLDNID